MGLTLEKGQLFDLGEIGEVIVTKDDTLMLNGKGSEAEINQRCEQISHHIKNSTSDYEREKLSERLARLSSGVGVIKCGGGSEVEVGEKKDRVEDALNATRAAVEEGIVPGGGVALLYSGASLDDVTPRTEDEKVGINIVRKALSIPCRTICENAGLEGAVVAG